MKNSIFLKTLLLFLTTVFLISCSGERNETKERNALEKVQHEIAKEAVSTIKTPINKADKVKELLDNRSLDLNKANKID